MSKSDEKTKKDDDLEKHDPASGEEGEEGGTDESEDEEKAASDEGDEGDEESSDDEEEDDEEDDEEEDVGDASGFAAKYGAERPKTRPRRARAAADDPNHGDDDVAAPTYGDEDPFWWAPHAVLGSLVVLGMLGFFGIFNKPLAFMRAPMKTETAATEVATPPVQGATPTPPPHPPSAPTDQQPPREMMGAKHLLVMYLGSRRAPPDIKRTKEEAKTRAAEAAKKAKSGKVKFEDVVKEYTDEPGGGQRGGDLGTFPKGAMVPEFQAGLDKLKVGEISDVVESPFGYHVILRTK